MIRINLLREKKAKRVDRGQQALLGGFLLVILVLVAGALLVLMPLQDKVSAIRRDNDTLSRSITELKSSKKIKEHDALAAQLKALEEEATAIARLEDARATPAWMLHELSNVLTKNHQPSMTDEMLERTRQDPNRKMTPGWDPKRVWLLSIEERSGEITIKGGAQADSDVTQFALRLQASAYFDGIQPIDVQTAQDPTAKVNFYKFTVTGKVRY
jgi:type IV pilus assembly protein PilN